MKQLDFTIIVPSFNRAPILPGTLRSILAQSQQNFEVIIVDDGSSDDTAGAVRALGDERLKLYRIEHQGRCAARNAGLQQAAGDIICFVDSDDAVEPHFLACVERAFADSSVDFVSSNCLMTRELIIGGRTVSVKTVEMPEAAEASEIALWKKKVPLGTGTCLRACSFLGRVRWDDQLKIMEEVDFFIQLYLVSPGGYRYLPERLFTYRQRHNSDGVCSRVSYAQIAETYELLYLKYRDEPLFAGCIERFLDLKSEYRLLAEREARGEIGHHMYRYFPEFTIPALAAQETNP